MKEDERLMFVRNTSMSCLLINENKIRFIGKGNLKMLTFRQMLTATALTYFQHGQKYLKCVVPTFLKLQYVIKNSIFCKTSGRNFLVFKSWQLFGLEERKVPHKYSEMHQSRILLRKTVKIVCEKCRGIFIRCIAGKVLGRVIFIIIPTHLVNNIYTETWCDFRSFSGFVAMTYYLRQ